MAPTPPRGTQATGRRPAAAAKPAAAPAARPAAAKPAAAKPAAAATPPVTSFAPPPTRKPMKGRSTNYSFATHGQTSKGVPMGDRTIRAGSNCDLVRPAFENADALIFRPFPSLTDTKQARPTQEKFEPFKTDADAAAFSDFMRTYPAAKGVGLEGIRSTFLLYDPNDVVSGAYDPRSNPYHILFYAIKNAIRNRTIPNVKWMDLVPSDKQDKVLSPPTTLLFIQGAIYVKGTEMYIGRDNATGANRVPRGLGPDDKTQVIQLTSSAGDRMVEMFKMPNPEWTGSDTDFEHALRFGDPVAWNKGRFIRIADINKLPTTQLAGLEGEGWLMNGEDQYAGNGGGRMQQKGYTVFIDEVLTVMGGVQKTKISPALDKAQAVAIKNRIRYWDEILHVPTHEELCLWIAHAMKGAADVVEFGWQDHPEFLTAEVRQILRSATQIYVGSPIPTQAQGQAQTAGMFGAATGVSLDEWVDGAVGGEFAEPAAEVDPELDGLDEAATTEELDELSDTGELEAAVDPDELDGLDGEEGAVEDELDAELAEAGDPELDGGEELEGDGLEGDGLEGDGLEAEVEGELDAELGGEGELEADASGEPDQIDELDAVLADEPGDPVAAADEGATGVNDDLIDELCGAGEAASEGEGDGLDEADAAVNAARRRSASRKAAAKATATKPAATKPAAAKPAAAKPAPQGATAKKPTAAPAARPAAPAAGKPAPQGGQKAAAARPAAAPAARAQAAKQAARK